ncbi:hypothetical protein IGI04_016970 [Brassica rapa subsp. trilocularis]|uniref:Uncharacterized protein n=1 Tax=Brassica rapa subsp. trilocularis TaxID=1813537 RepID=A0ABQ7MUH1_BRACM|nr:hypothetical protein IGI04_016970 [Brassica rapa subsp. trilocularis]
MVLGKALNRIAKDLYNMTRANVAVFSRSDQGREYQYSSHVAGSCGCSGLDALMDRVGYTPTMEFDLVRKLRRDSDALALNLGGRSMDELAGLENQLMLAMESIQAAEANLG